MRFNHYRQHHNYEGYPMFNVSIIVPVYKSEQYLASCLDSLAKQTLENVEVIVVIDASPDSCAAIAGEYCLNYPERFRKIVLEKNVGVSMARNIAMQSAQGEYIGFVDSDDYAEANMFELMFSEALNSNADVVSCQMRSFETHDSSVEYHNLPTKEYYDDTFVTNKLFRRVYLLSKQINFYSNVIFEDEPFAYTARFATDNLAEVNQVLYNYRMSPEGLCRGDNHGRFNLYDKQLMLARFLADMERRGAIDAHAEELLQCLANHALSALYYHISAIDLVGFFSFVDHLVIKYQLLERAGDCSQDYKVSRYLKFRGSAPRIILLSYFVKARQAKQKFLDNIDLANLTAQGAK
ncbi:glycosyltransferase family 2 protein [Agarivorans sp. 1_MG-2023]|uniref:glycosyltransferase family 2 protein n=2 Tax=unclassified Agarivorans TaxID=2636026 RepID=UPI0026E44A74|nr:glycosyltransferase family 2 protein [Agarivorans sp. 1_MG-2023]MDO6761923.1 glycosyltransferase family 2 protein [Agarivorans sp. 1_MG-2023]